MAVRLVLGGPALAGWCLFGMSEVAFYLRRLFRSGSEILADGVGRLHWAAPNSGFNCFPGHLMPGNGCDGFGSNGVEGCASKG